MTATLSEVTDAYRYGELAPLGCAACQRTFLGPNAGALCPLCGGGTLAPQSARVHVAPPELVVPFGLGRQSLRAALERHLDGQRWPTRDMTLDLLDSRVEQVWWPIWLFDAACTGSFDAEVGFDMTVRSTEESFEDGSWSTRQVERQRVRWEPRLGTVNRSYHNAPVVALGEHAAMVDRLGDFPLGAARPPSSAPSSWILLPDRGPTEVWPEAVDALVHAVADEVAAAVDAPHVRGATVVADWSGVNATWALLPVYVTWYVDDKGKRRVWWVHGGTGRVWGPRLRATRTAWLVALPIVLIGLLTLGFAAFVALIGVVMWILLPVALLIGLVAVAIMALGLWPVFWVRRHNHRELAR